MSISRILVYAFILYIAGCAKNAHSVEVSIPNGWVEVKVSNRAILAADNEFLGALIGRGLDIEQAHWIKPLFGNENVIWFTDQNDIGLDYYTRLKNTSKHDFPSASLESGTLEVSGVSWRYAGYQYDDHSLTQKVFLCGNTPRRLVLLYWGAGEIQKDSIITEMQIRLADRCK